MTAPTIARAHGGRVAHLLVAGTKTTECGEDATLMARYAPADCAADSVVRPFCEACRSAREVLVACGSCGSTFTLAEGRLPEHAGASRGMCGGSGLLPFPPITQ